MPDSALTQGPRVWSPWHRLISEETALTPTKTPTTWPCQNKKPFRK
jgi:hypothetical protein